MPRKKTHTKEELTLRAMEYFWNQGFHGTSMDDLVNATGISRHGMYSEFKGKQELFLACLSLYQKEIVTPAFSRVESKNAGLNDIAGYFEFQISRAEQAGLPGPGCLVANTLTEIAPHHPEVMKATEAHNTRLRKGFEKSLSNSNAARLRPAEIRDLASFVLITAQGLWSISRIINRASVLRRQVSTLMSLLETRLSYAR